MKLILFRHGSAAPKSTSHSDLDDFRRELTRRGRKETRRMARVERRLLREVTLIATSPLLRASETADILHRNLKTPAFELWTELDSLNPSEDVVNALPKEGTILLVGHEPQLTSIATLLLRSPGLKMELPKSGILFLEKQNAEWSLRRLTGLPIK